MQLKDQIDPELRKIIKTQKHAAVIPVGSIEQHGPHLPISTDSDIVSEISKRLCEQSNFLLLPTITYGVSFEHAPFFNISLRGATLQNTILDICKSLSLAKISTIFVINGHHGNQKTLNQLCKKIQKRSKIKVFVFSYWHFMSREFDHAGEIETSLMLAISKKVQMKKAKKGLDTSNLSKKEKDKISKIASKSFPRATKNGVWGDPTKASAKLGRQLLSEILRNLKKKSQTCLTDKNRKLHQ